MKMLKTVSLVLLVAALFVVYGCSPGEGGPPIIDEDGNVLTVEEMAALLEEGGWTPETIADDDGSVKHILMHRDSQADAMPQSFEPPPGAFVIDETTVIRDEDEAVVTLDEFEQRMSEGGWAPEPEFDDDGQIIAIVLRRGDGRGPAMGGPRPSFMGDSDRWMGESLPTFDVVNLNGQPIRSSEARAQVVVLNFWFRACKPCIMEIPELNELVETFKNQNVQFIAFSMDSEADAREAVAKTPFDYEVVAESGALHKELGVMSYPTHMVFDQNGTCIAAYQGYSPAVTKSVADDVRRALADSAGSH